MVSEVESASSVEGCKCASQRRVAVVEYNHFSYLGEM